MALTSDELMAAAWFAIDRVRSNIRNSPPEWLFNEVIIPSRDSVKKMLTIDLVAERTTGALLMSRFGKRRIRVIGEESLSPDLTLEDERRVVALLDMIDGTDLLARGLHNWCSAVVFFQAGEILAAAVGVPDGRTFFASRDRDRAFWRRRGTREVVDVRGPDLDVRLHDASLCFYGQKAHRLLYAADHAGFRTLLEQVASVDQAATRLYNLAGNPMMLKVVDGPVRLSSVFEIIGQLPHDVVPGAYIASKAGAKLTDLQGRDIDLAKALLTPAKRSLKFILAANGELSESLVEALGERRSEPDSLVTPMP